MTRNATTEEIDTGYRLVNWRHALEAVEKAFGRSTMDAFKIAEENLTLVEQTALGMQFGASHKAMFKACMGSSHVAAAHDAARRVLKSAGVRTITNQDFIDHEDGFDYTSLGVYGADIRQDDEGYYLRIPIGGGGCR